MAPAEPASRTRDDRHPPVEPDRFDAACSVVHQAAAQRRHPLCGILVSVGRDPVARFVHHAVCMGAEIVRPGGEEPWCLAQEDTPRHAADRGEDLA
jgi:hypothetical protein